MSEGNRLMTAQEISQVLALPLQSIWRLAREKAIPSYRAGRLLRFDLERVLEAMEQEASVDVQA